MAEKTDSRNLKRRGLAAAVYGLVMLAAHATANAQETFKAGEKVSASPMMLKSDSSYKPCTVVKFDQGAGAYLLDCDGAQYNVPPGYVRRGKNQDTGTKAAAAAEPDKAAAAAPTGDGKFKVDDRVLASVGGLKGDKYYQPCTVTKELKDNAYGLRCDPHNGNPVMEYSVRPDWIRVWDNPTPEPALAQCPFNKDFGPVSNSAAASPALFQSVIYEWQKSISDFYDFGITFMSFQMQGSFKNRAIGQGRKGVDTAPVGATIYPVKAKELICQKSSTITKRWVREIEYACYKNGSEWVCKNGAPKYLEQTSIPNK